MYKKQLIAVLTSVVGNNHINSVKGNPRLARTPDNIEFVKGRKEHLARHDNNFQNPTSGSLKNRKIK